MKALVKKAFYDVKDGVDRRPGDEFEATKARIDEITERLGEGWVQPIPTKRATKKQVKESEE